ncbi:MAG: SDR family NAD(P)-dependent oxidoreductase [Acidimicrobiales bacterium]
MEIDGAVMIITGAGSGVGAATARAANAAGAHLVLAGRRQEKINAVADELRAARSDRSPLAIPTDVTDVTDLEGLVGRTLDEHGRIDVLINNAGQGFYASVAEADLDLYRRILEVNLVAPLAAMQAVLPSMRDCGRGVIINVSSGASLGVYPTTGAYASTKAALNQLMAVARAELAPEGITVSLIHPYLTESEFNQALLGGDPILAPAEAPQHNAEYVATKLIDLIRSGDEVTVLLPA